MSKIEWDDSLSVGVDWLINHIKGIDLKLGKFLSEKGSANIQ